MILATTPGIEHQHVVRYLGLVSADVILGATIVRDFFASIRDIVGGRAAAYEAELRKANEIALGIDIDCETIDANSSMLMVSANGTAVVVE